jgi:hypothetical protein
VIDLSPAPPRMRRWISHITASLDRSIDTYGIMHACNGSHEKEKKKISMSSQAPKNRDTGDFSAVAP